MDALLWQIESGTIAQSEAVIQALTRWILIAEASLPAELPAAIRMDLEAARDLAARAGYLWPSSQERL